MPTLEVFETDTLNTLLTSLLAIIKHSTINLSILAVERLLVYLKRNEKLVNLLRPTTELLKSINLKRMLGSQQDYIIFDMFVFLLKYYPDIHYSDFDLNKE